MLSVACLLNDTQLVEDLKTVVEFFAYQRAANFGTAPLRGVYADIRSAGIEVDLRTVGYIYAEVLPTTEKPFDSKTEVDDLVGANFKNLADAMMNPGPRTEDRQTGAMSPEEYVVYGMGRLFWEAQSPTVKVDTDMRIMQEALYKGARRLLKMPPSQPKNKEDWETIINKALAVDSMGIPNLQGGINRMEDLFDAMKAEIARLQSNITDPYTSAEFDAVVAQLKNATYGVMLNHKEARQILIDTLKEAGFAKKISSGKEIIDWVKLAGNNNSVSDLRNNVTDVLLSKNYSPRQINMIKNALEQEFYALHAEMMKKSDAALKRRQQLANTPRKSDLHRLSELNHLGIFNSSYDDVLYKVLGVDELTQADIRDIKEITVKMDQLANDVKSAEDFKGKEFFASYAFRTLQKQINDVLTKNINDRTKALKIIKGIDYWYQVKNTGLIMNYANLFENNTSGAVETLAATVQQMVKMGPKAILNDWNILQSTWLDVAKGGIHFGSGETRFGDYTGAESSIAKKNTLLKKALSKLMAPARYFLSGSDSAFKAVLTRKAFMMNVHDALIAKHGMSKDEATKFINEALYGQSFEDAKKEARILLQKYNLPSEERAVVRLADDLVKANLMAGNKIDFDVIEAAYNAAFNVASVGLGHKGQSNSVFGLVSEKLQDMRAGFKRDQAMKIKAGDMNGLAYSKAFSVFMNQMTLFMGGQMNWLQLRLDKTGMGIVTGLLGKWKGDIDFSSKEDLEQSMYDLRAANQKIYRGAVGLVQGITMAGIASALFYALRDDDDENKGFFAELFAKVKESPVGNRIFKKSAPEWFLFWYYGSLSKASSMAANGAEQSKVAAFFQQSYAYLQDAFNITDRYSAATKLSDAGILASRAVKKNGEIDLKKMSQAEGKLGQIIGDQTELPLFRPYQSYIQLLTNGKIPYGNAETFMNGVFQGGLLHRTGVYQKQLPVEVLPGVGNMRVKALRERGINNAYQLVQVPGWQNLTTKDGDRIFREQDAAAIDSMVNGKQ